MDLRVKLISNHFVVNFEDIGLSISHKVQNSVTEGLKVILSGLIQALVGANGCILDSSKEAWRLLLDMIIIVQICKMASKIYDVNFSIILGSEVRRLDVSVEET